MAYVKYDSNGLQKWDSRYNYDNNTNITPAGILASKSGNIFIAQTIYATDRSVWNIRKFSQPGFTPVEVEKEIIIPSKFILYQNYPNPFNPSTTIRYAIPQTSFVSIKIYDILGRQVATLVDEEKPAGSYEVEFSAVGGSASGGDAKNLSSGVYFYKVQAGEYVNAKKMILLR
jgi:hypothetical protein